MKHLKKFGSKIYESAGSLPTTEELLQAMESGAVKSAAEKLTDAQLAKALAGAAELVDRAQAGEFDNMGAANERRGYRNSYRRLNESQDAISVMNNLSNVFTGVGLVGMIGGAAAAITMAMANGEYEMVPDAAKDGATDIQVLKPDFYSAIPGAIIFACGALSLLIGSILGMRADEMMQAQRRR